MTPSLPRRLAAEALGTAFIAVAVIGSGIMAERLAGGNAALALLAHALATAGALYVIILALAPISGAHFNPVVSMVTTLARELEWRDLMPYVLAQVLGGVVGALVANGMFGLDVFQWSTKARSGGTLWLGELVATFGLVACIRLCTHCAPGTVPASVAAYIGAAYWFTSSTSFANPAITIARTLSDSFAGIAPASAPAFIAAQVVSALASLALCRWLLAEGPPRSS